MNTVILSALVLSVVAMSSATGNYAYVAQPGYYYNYAPAHTSSSVAFNSNAVKYNYGVAQTGHHVVKAVAPQVKYVVPQVHQQQVKYVVPQVHQQQVKYVVPQVHQYVQPQVKYVYQPNTYTSPVYAYKHAYPQYYGNHVVSTLG